MSDEEDKLYKTLCQYVNGVCGFSPRGEMRLQPDKKGPKYRLVISIPSMCEYLDLDPDDPFSAEQLMFELATTDPKWGCQLAFAYELSSETWAREQEEKKHPVRNWIRHNILEKIMF